MQYIVRKNFTSSLTRRDKNIRFAEHKRSGTNKAGLDFDVIPGRTGLTKMDARIVEQNLINQHGMQRHGGTLFNQRNSIAPRDWGHWNVLTIRF